MIPTAIYHKTYMSALPPYFRSNEGPDRTHSWLKEVEKAFDIVEISERLSAKFGIYMLVDDAKA